MVLYSEDPGSIATGGAYQIDKKTSFVKEFKDVAFALREGEISSPFKTIYGYHIVYLEKIDGPKLNIRHILISPKPSEEAIREAEDRIVKLRERILNKEITFKDAARMYSESKETNAAGGLISFGYGGQTKISAEELVQEEDLFYAVDKLEEKEVSQPFLSQTQKYPKRYSQNSTESAYKIVELTRKIPAHKADFENDYMAIKEQALLEKQKEAVQKWINKKVKNTYIRISDKYSDCDFSSDWLKNNL